VGTLQGQSRGSDKIRYGFEFTIPLTLKRYFGRRAESPSTDTVVSVAAVQVDTTAQAEKPAETTVPSPVVETPAPPAPTPAPSVSTQPAPTSRPVTATPKPAPPKPVARVRKTVIKNISYLQPKITVAVGTTVEWTNNDPLPHSVTAVDKSFNSGLIQPGKTYRHTFTRAGTFNF
jgi:plastocyanin